MKWRICPFCKRKRRVVAEYPDISVTFECGHYWEPDHAKKAVESGSGPSVVPGEPASGEPRRE